MVWGDSGGRPGQARSVGETSLLSMPQDEFILTADQLEWSSGRQTSLLFNFFYSAKCCRGRKDKTGFQSLSSTFSASFPPVLPSGNH